jgi:hypothetical protein
MAKEAIKVYLELMHEDGLPIPTVHPQQGRCPGGVSSGPLNGWVVTRTGRG